MAASNFVSIVQHRQARAQQVRPTIFRDRPARPRQRVRAVRPTGMAGVRMPKSSTAMDAAWAKWGKPHTDRWGEQYDSGPMPSAVSSTGRRIAVPGMKRGR